MPEVKNPSRVSFVSPDHARVEITGYELDIVGPTGAVVQTLTVAKSSTAVVGPDVVVTVNIQPVNFGSYTFRARTIAGAQKSDDSTASDAWSRSPGAPSKPTVA